MGVSGRLDQEGPPSSPCLWYFGTHKWTRSPIVGIIWAGALPVFGPSRVHLVQAFVYDPWPAVSYHIINIPKKFKVLRSPTD